MTFTSDYQAAANALILADSCTNDETIVAAISAGLTALGGLSSDLGATGFVVPGGTTSRTLAERALDRANVLDYGAVADTAFDSTAAFRAAIATGRAVYVPKGIYKITDILTLQTAQMMYGDGRGVSRLYINSTFNLAALGIVRLATSETAAAIQDFSIELQQPDVATRASLIAYPPAIYAQNCGRFRIERVRVYGAMTGLDARGNAGGSYINMLEMAAYEYGMRWEGALDMVHLNDYHFWPFGTTVNQQTMFFDGNTFAAEFGKVDGLSATNFFSLSGKVQFLDSPSSVQGWAEISNMLMDGNYACVEVDNCNWIHINNFYSTKSGSAAVPPTLLINGGNVRVSNFEINHGTVAAPVQVTGGELFLTSGSIRKGGNKNGAATVSGGKLHVDTVSCIDSGGGALGTALFTQSGTGVLRVFNSSYAGTCTSGEALSFANDDPLHCVSAFAYGVLTLTVPAGVKANGPAMARYEYPERGGLTSGSAFNTAYGALALAAGIVGSQSNTAFGDNAGAAITTGNSNDLFGRGAGQAITTGTNNVGIGRLALSGVTTGSANTAVGFAAMQTGTGANNTVLGRQAGNGITSGNFNTVIGHQVGSGGNLGTGQGNILIGSNNVIDTSVLSVSHTFRLGGWGGTTFYAQGLDTVAPAWTFLGTVNFDTTNTTSSIGVNGATIRAGAGAPTGTHAKGSIWMRSDGAAGTTLYVSQGGGTWTPVAGV